MQPSPAVKLQPASRPPRIFDPHGAATPWTAEIDNGLTDRNWERPGLQEALVITKLARLARSLPDARDIIEDLTQRNVQLIIGGSIHDPIDPVGRLLFIVLAMVVEFASDLIRARTREGMQVANAKGLLRGQ